MANASKQVSARERARAASLRFYELEKQREAVQARYFGSMESVDRIHAVRDREIAAAHRRAESAAQSAIAEADVAIRELLELNVPRPEVQQRLGCTAADVRRAIDAAAPSAGGVDDADANNIEVDEAADVVDGVASAEDVGGAVPVFAGVSA